jgi:hypothetical protein
MALNELASILNKLLDSLHLDLQLPDSGFRDRSEDSEARGWASDLIRQAAPLLPRFPAARVAPPAPHMCGRGGTPWGLSASQPPVEFRPYPPWVVGASSGRVPGPKFAAGTAAGAAWRISGSLGGP